MAIQEMISESGTVKVGKETKKASDLYGQLYMYDITIEQLLATGILS